MKTKDLELKEVIKEAILEAFAEMHGVATLNEDTDDSAPEDGDGGNNNSGNNGSGNGPKEPDPMIGVGGYSLR